ncbi:MAG TPA: hypothetical protein VGF94_07280 [Kofleriaceae bacterium]|jgi:hypothetical protein
MKRILLAAAALAGCTSQPTVTPLADLQKQFGDVQLEVIAKGSLAIEMHVNNSGDCPAIGQDVIATFDGANMEVLRGGPDTNASGCYPIAFWFDVLPQATLDGFEVATTRSELVVADKSSTWMIDTPKLFANDFFVDQDASTITWADVTQIQYAHIEPAANLTIDGNVIHYPAGMNVQEVHAHAEPVASRCDGPQQCGIDLTAGRQLTSTPQ